MMNKKNLQQIFANYIDRFDILNDEAHNETFKWWAASRFRVLMDEALQAPEEKFTQALDRIKGHRKEDKVVETILESSMQPFTGLIKLSEHEPGRVQKMLRELLADDGNNLDKREEKIKRFFDQCKPLENQYFSGNFRYKQTANSVSGYLFLYDPDNHYMYKAKQAKLFADCMEYYGDWGSGDQIKLKEYYGMCDALVKEIEECPALIATDKSRNAIKDRYPPPVLAEDEKHHILAYDIIYCSMVYNLFQGTTFKTITAQEKRLYDERMKKAQEKWKEYLQAEEKYQQLGEAIRHYDSVLVPGTSVWNRINGAGVIENRNRGNIAVRFANGAVGQYDRFATIADQWLTFEDTLDEEAVQRYRKLCKDHLNIKDTLSRTRNALKEYEDILE